MNNFSHDNNCVAVWRFETAGITDDSKGTNTLTNVGADGELIIKKEGDQSARFIRTNNDYMHIADTALDTGFPFKNSDGTSARTDISGCFWCYFDIKPSVDTKNYALFCKYDYSFSGRTIMIRCETTSDRLSIYMGYNGGASSEVDYFSVSCDATNWYHVGFGYRASDKTYFICVYDDNASAALGAPLTGTFAQTVSLVSATVTLGATGNPALRANAYLDEVVVWNVTKSIGDIEKVRKGTYNYNEGGNLGLGLNTGLSFAAGG